jgi:uncharacterized protein
VLGIRRVGGCRGAAAHRARGRQDRDAERQRYCLARQDLEGFRGPQRQPGRGADRADHSAGKIGRRKIDDGAILVVAKDDRKLRIEVGYGLEGALTDVTAKRIIDEVITPKFRSGDFAGGISDGVNRILRVVDGEPLPAPKQRPQNPGFAPGFDDLFNPFLIFAALIAGGIFRGIFGRLFGSLATGGLVAGYLWFIAAPLVLSAIGGAIAFLVTMFSDAMTSSGGPGRGGSWVSSGGGFSGGSSSSDSGGFSGGGGSFGGGGASGSW